MAISFSGLLSYTPYIPSEQFFALLASKDETLEKPEHVSARDAKKCQAMCVKANK